VLSRSLVRVLALVATLAVAACSPGSSAAPSGSAGASSRTPLVVGLGYIPSVQFAPFYLAEKNGWYRDAGLEVTFQNKIDPDLVTLVGQGSVDLGLSDGTSVIPAVSQGIPIRYIATVYGSFPSVVVAKASSGIRTAADLKGRKLGTPGRYGSSWIMLQALLKSVNLTTDDLQIVEYPDFGQAAALQQGQIDAATGFANNEPVQLAQAGIKVTVLRVDDVIPLQGPGLIAGKSTLDTKPDAVRAFVAVTLRAMDAIAANPDAGLDAAIATVPELGQNRDTQKAILQATIETWQSPRGTRFGALDAAGWESSITFMTDLKLVPKPVTVDDVIDGRFLPAR